MNKFTKKTIRLLICILFLILIIISGAIYFIYATNEDINTLNRRFLSEIATQNANAMKKTVEIQLDKVATISNVIRNETTFDIESVMRILTSETNRSSFKRMGYADVDGNAKTTDGQIFNIQSRAYFKKAMSGKMSVSDRLVDKVGGSYINVYAVPLYRDKQIDGIVFATNNSDDFVDLINTKTFNGNGYTYVVKNDGTPIAYPNRGKGSSSDLYDLLNDSSESTDDENKVNLIEQDMAKEKDGYISYTWNGVERLGAYCKIGIEDWYVVTLVSKDVITANTNRIVLRNIGLVSLTSLMFIVLLILIIVQNRKGRKALEKIAYIDEITDCLNFKAFKKLAQNIIDSNKSHTYTFVMFDVENFKYINDRFGYETGNMVLKNIAKSLHEVVKKQGEVYARVGADEFIIMLEDVREHLLDDIRNTFVRRFNEIMGGEFHHLIKFQSGIYLTDISDKNMEAIYEKVNYAHRKAKMMISENDIVEFFYNEEVKAQAIQTMEIINTMEQALQEESFLLYIQPKYRLDKEIIAGGEVLVRWQLKDGTLRYPGEFIPLFEKNGFIVKLDMYIFEQTCKHIQRWMREHIPLVCISVNFSRLHLFDANFIKNLVKIANRYQVPTNYIELELTETIFLENEDVLQSVIIQAHEAGFSVSMDDFGNGYSSLGLLKNIHVDVIKVDRNFFVNNPDEDRTKIVVEYVMKMAQKLGVHTLAEGIETKEHIDMLKEFGCEYVQGYYYAKPMPVEAFEQRLKKLKERK